jgi:hypothetical protein
MCQPLGCLAKARLVLVLGLLIGLGSTWGIHAPTALAQGEASPPPPTPLWRPTIQLDQIHEPQRGRDHARLRPDPVAGARAPASAAAARPRLEEARQRAEAMLGDTRRLEGALEQQPGSPLYQQLATQLEVVGTELDTLLSRIRALNGTTDPGLQSDAARMAALDRFVDVFLEVVRHAERMPGLLQTAVAPVVPEKGPRPQGAR